MSKFIRYQRDELVWQTRVIDWGKRDWENLKSWVKTQAEKAEMPENADSGWYQTFINVYAAIKDMSWDEALVEYEKWDNSEDNQLCWTNSYTYYDGTEHSYKVYFGEWLREMMQEDVYDADITNEEYADDYEEDIRIVEEDD